MGLSVFQQLKAMEEAGTVEVVKTSPRHKLPGEGAYFHKGSPVQVLTNFYARETQSQPDLSFDAPHDVAWCPDTKEVLAYSLTDSGLPPGAEPQELDLE